MNGTMIHDEIKEKNKFWNCVLFHFKIIILPGVQCECEMWPRTSTEEEFEVRVLKNAILHNKELCGSYIAYYFWYSEI
jgi:hypothetical protein